MGHILVRLPKNSTQQQVNTVSQIFTSQRDLLVCSHLPSRNACASMQHLRMLAREEQLSCLLEIFQGLVFNSQVIKAIFLSSMLYHLIFQYFGSLCINENNAVSLTLQSVVLRCIFPRTEKHSNGMVQSAISLPLILFLSTSWSVCGYASPTLKQAYFQRFRSIILNQQLPFFKTSRQPHYIPSRYLSIPL